MSKHLANVTKEHRLAVKENQDQLLRNRLHKPCSQTKVKSSMNFSGTTVKSEDSAGSPGHGNENFIVESIFIF